MGITYERLDTILSGLAAGLSSEEVGSRFGIDEKEIQYVVEMKRLSGKMREPPATLLHGDEGKDASPGAE